MQVLVSLKFGDGDFQQGFSYNENIVDVVNIEGKSTKLEIQLPPAPEIPISYQKWENSYSSLVSSVRMGFKPKQTTNFSWFEDYRECDRFADDLRFRFNTWLFKLKLQLKSVIELNADSETILTISTQHIESQLTKDILHRLPWREWDYFPGNYSVEVALSLNESRNNIIGNKNEEIFRRVRITSIFGDSQNIDITTDKELIERLKQRGAELILLSQPKRPDFIKLWDEPCDILFYSGHSQTNRKDRVGSIKINDRQSLNPQEIRHTFHQAIAKGLKLAIFNSCDGLGLAEQFADLNLPYIIVWREAVPDKVAQSFLKYFLSSFAQGKSLFASMRNARVKLQELTDIEDTQNQLPGLNWLPIICQNTTEPPPNWENLGGLTGKLPQSPYKGLSAFREEDAALFFGRDKFIADLVEAVNTKPLVPVVGASGSGKSSVVFAGLVPRLKDSDNVQIVSFRPGKNPFDALAVALSAHCQSLLSQYGEGTEDSYRLKKLGLEINLDNDEKELCKVIESIINFTFCTQRSLQRFILITDQFEELYTLTTSKQRQQVLDAFLCAVKFAPSFTLVLTLRADFMGKVLDYEPMGEALQIYPPMLLTPMKRSELRAAIEKPAENMKVELEEGLTSKLIDDLGKQPGRLPLLEFTLAQLWQKPNKWYLTHQTYEEIGGLEKALAKYADGVLNLLGAAEKAQAERIFIQLVRPGEGTEDTKRLATCAEVGENNWNLVKSLADNRLVVTGWDGINQIETVEIIHEALIREWGTLREWIRRNREFRIWQERLKPDVWEWENKEYDPEILLQGTRLAIAEEWYKQRPDELTLLGRDFITASVAKRDRERREHKHRRQLTISALLGGLMLVSAFASISEIRRTDAEVGKISSIAEKLFSQGDHEAALTEAMKAGKLLSESIWKPWIAPETRMQVASTLNQTVYGYQIKTLKGHLSEIIGVSFSPNGKIIASGSGDRTIKLWDIHTGKEIKTLTGHKLAVIDVSFSPDGKTIASGSGDNTIKLWDIGTGKEIKTLLGHSSGVLSVSFSPDGQTIASASGDNTVKLWDVKTGKEIKTFRGHSHDVYSLSFSPDGKTIASGSSDSTVKLWDVDTGQETKTLEGHEGGVTNVKFSPDGKFIVSGSRDHTIRVWKFDTGEKIKILKEHSGAVNSVSFSPNGQTIASGSNDHTLKLWDTNIWKNIQTFKGHSDRVRSTSFSPDGEIIASGSIDGTVKIRNIRNNTLKKNKTFKKHSYQVISASFSPDGQNIVSGSRGGTLKLWNHITEKEIHTLEGHSGEIRGFSLSPDGKIIASGTERGTINIWDSITGSEIRTLKGHSDQIRSISFSPNGKIIASSSSDRTIKLWDSVTGSEIKTLQGHSRRVTSVSFSPNGKIIASSSSDRTIKLWDSVTGSEIKTLQGHSRRVNSVSFFPDNKMIVSGSGDRTVRLWDTSTGKEIQTLQGHFGTINSVSFSPDGKTIISTSRDGTVKLQDIESAGKMKNLTLRSSSINSIDYSSDGKIIASASGDHTVRLWDTNTGKEIKTLKHSSVVNAVSFSPNSKIIASGLDDGTVKTWNVNTGEQIKTLRSLSERVNTLKFSPDGKIVASGGSKEHTVKLWDVATGEKIRTLKGHFKEVTSISFSPNGKLIASGSADNTIKLWERHTANELKTLRGHSDKVISVSFSPDGKIIASGSADRNLQLWDANTGRKIKTLKGNGSWVRSVSFSPDGKTIVSTSIDGKVMLWNFDLVSLLSEGCDLMRGYLENNPDVNERERHLCDNIDF